MSEAQALAQIVKRLDDVRDNVRDDIAALRTDIAAVRDDLVDVHKHTAAIEALDRRLTRIESESRDRHIPWPTIVMAITAAITLGVLIYT